MKRSKIQVRLSRNIDQIESMISIAKSSMKRTPSRVRVMSQANQLERPKTPGVRLLKQKKSLELSPSLSSMKSFIKPSPKRAISPSQVKRLFSAKCTDLKIEPMLDQETRFQSYCDSAFAHRKFMLCNAGLGLESAIVVGKTLKNSSDFAFIHLSRNSLSDYGCIILARALLHNTCIVHLDLSSNDLSPQGASIFFKILSDHPTLQSLNVCSHEGLRRNRLGEKGAEALKEYVQGNPVLSMVNISKTSIGTEGLDRIVSGLINNTSLLSLNISSNQLGRIDNLCKNLPSSQLLELNLAENELGNHSCEAIASMISSSQTLKKLDLSKNNIKSKGLGQLFDGLRINRQLVHLNLENNNFADGIPIKWTPFISENFTLLSLNLSRCEIKANAVRILEGLTSNKGLKHLSLSGNYLDNSSMYHISRVLMANNTLKTLDLSSNNIKSKGGIQLATALNINRCLEVLNLRDNKLKDEAACSFNEVIRNNPRLKKLFLENNPVNLKCISDVKRSTSNNQIRHKMNLIPSLKSNNKIMKVSEDDILHVKSKTELLANESKKIQNDCKKKMNRLENIRESEKDSFLKLSDELNRLRKNHQQVIATLKKLEETSVVEKTRQTREITSFEIKIAQLDSLIKSKEKTSIFYTETKLIKAREENNSSHSEVLQKYREELKQAERVMERKTKDLQALKQKTSCSVQAKPRVPTNNRNKK